MYVSSFAPRDREAELCCVCYRTITLIEPCAVKLEPESDWDCVSPEVAAEINSAAIK